MCNSLENNVTLTVNADQRDPSRTSALRRLFDVEMSKRFNSLIRAIKKSIVSEDVFGLRDNINNNNLEVLQDITTPGRRAFAFDTDHRKITAFMQWLRSQVEAGILDVADFNQVGESINSAWTNKYIHDSYRRGVARARQQLRAEGLEIPSIEASGGIAAVMTNPIHIERVGMVYIRAFNELVGITDNMAQVVSRVLALGMAEGQGPNIIAKMLVHAISGTGSTLDLPISYINPRTGRLVQYTMPAKTRARILARTEIIRSHAVGQLQEFASWGAVGVTAQAEFQTAGDNRVCPICESLEGRVYTIQEAYNVIPVHPQCRCIWLPLIK